MSRLLLPRRAVLAGAAVLAAPAVVRAAAPVEISLYFPVAVGGPITRLIDAMAQAFQAQNPDVAITPVYAGGYVDTLTKAITASKGGQGPTLAVLLSTDAYTLIDAELVVPFDGLAKDDAWLATFYPAFLKNTQIDGRNWGVPFQRSTIVLYYNKDLFHAAGLDPEVPPPDWAAHAEAAAKLTARDGSGNVTRWGVQIPGTGFTYWLYQALVTEAGGTISNANGTETYFDTPECAAALQYWIDLAQTQKAHPPGIVEWGTTPRDFLEGRAAMIWTTTGNLSFVRNGAKFPFGVGMLPAGQRRGSPTGGGNFYLFRSATEAQRQAALRFVQWATTPERAAQWGIDTGYVATRPDAWQTDVMQKYVAGFPQAAVARDQLPYAVPEFSTHDNQRVTKILDDELQAALLGQKPAKTALADAQAGAARVLKAYRKG